MRRRLVSALLAVVFAVVGGMTGPAVAAPAPVRTMTFNACGNVCRLGEVDTTTGNIAYQIRRRNVAVAMVQELCYSQFLALRGRLTGYGYSAVFGNASNGKHCDGDSPGHGRGFGVAIVARGTLYGAVVQKLPSPYANEAEPRVALGVNVRLGGRSLFVVTTHTAPRGPNLVVQMVALRSWLIPVAAVRPVLFGGDLNSLPDNSDLDGFYAAYREANNDRVNPLPTFETAPRKIDYLFGAKRFLRPQAVATVCTGYSDHCMYLGEFA